MPQGRDFWLQTLGLKLCRGKLFWRGRGVGTSNIRAGKEPCECPGQGAPGCTRLCWQSPAECPRPSRGDCAEIRDVAGPQSCAKGTGLPLCALCVLPATQVLTESFSSQQRLPGTEIRGKSPFQEHGAAFLVPLTSSLSTCLGDG